MLNFEQCWQVPVGTRLYGLMPAARQGMIPWFLHALRRAHFACDRYQVQTVGRDPDTSEMLPDALLHLSRPQAFTRFPNVQIEAAPFLARQGSHHMPAPMIVQAFICRECIQLTQLNIMRCESDVPRLNCLWRMYRSIFVGFKKWRPRRSWWKHRIPVEYRTETYWIWVWTYYKSNIEYVWMCDMGVYIHNKS